MRRLLLALISLSLLLAQRTSVLAQGQAWVDLYPLDTSSFPTISALLDVFDTKGIFTSGLKPEAVTVMEDGQPLPAVGLGEMAVPLQIVLAVNQGTGLDTRDPTGLSRFQRAVQVLSGWVQKLPTNLPDDFSLVSQAGPVINHAGPADFRASLNAFQPDFRSSIPNLQSLAIAIDTASAQTPRPGMKRAVLFITPHMDDANIAEAIKPYIQRARDNKVRVFVWFVDADLYFMTTSAAAFNSLAVETGGSLFPYDGRQPFPDPESYFSPLRRVYVLTYSSRLTVGGEHTLSVEVKLPVGVLQSAEESFRLDVQPPNPILVEPPLQLTRRAPANDPFNTKILLPEQQEIEIIVDFPDQHPRPLLRTTLYVDGQVVDENTAEPFDKFAWDLTGYSLSGEHQIIVEAVDTLGLSKTSMSLPVTLTVIQPPRGPAALLGKYRQPITFGAIGLAGLALLAIFLTGLMRIPSLRAVRAARRADRDPLTQSVEAITEIPIPTTKEKPKRPRSSRKKTVTVEPKPRLVKAPASLLRLTPDGQPATSNPLPILENEVNFGTDPVLCNQVLDDPSLSALHAHLKHIEDDGYLLLDNSSTAGTWVNYEPVPPEGHLLKHGDVIHFGRLIFRFALRTPPAVSEPKVEYLQSEG
jgi:hypothetical protein